MKSIHSVLLGKPCQIMDLEIGQRGWLLVDVGDESIGPHRIVLSNVLRVEGEDDLCIETANTVYHLKYAAPMAE